MVTAPGTKLVEIENPTDATVQIDFFPWWGGIENWLFGPSKAIDPERFGKDALISPADSLVIYAHEPYFFRKGAFLLVWRETPRAPDASAE